MGTLWRRVARAAVLVALCAGGARAEEPSWDSVTLTDGRVLKGSIERRGSFLAVRLRYGEVLVAQDQVASLEDRRDPFDERAALEAQGFPQGTVEQRLRYATLLAEQQAPEAPAAYLAVLRLDPDHAGARAALGYVLVDGRWLPPAPPTPTGPRGLSPQERARRAALAAAEREAAAERAVEARAARAARADQERAQALALAAERIALVRERAREQAERAAREGPPPTPESLGLLVTRVPAGGGRITTRASTFSSVSSSGDTSRGTLILGFTDYRHVTGGGGRRPAPRRWSDHVHRGHHRR